jgi:hypothetical protein
MQFDQLKRREFIALSFGSVAPKAISAGRRANGANTRD